MRIAVLPVVLLVLAACNTAAPVPGGAEVSRVEVGDTRFRVIRAGDMVELHRTSPPGRTSREELFRNARLAVLAGTGCPARKGSFRGDTALFSAELDCLGSKPPVVEVDVACDFTGTAGYGDVTFDCIFRR